MRVNQRMLDAASEALGYEVDADRVRQAYDELEENLALPVAKARLKRLEQRFADAGGRGVDLADEIDHLRIYVATYTVQGDTYKEVTLTVKVKVPDTLTDLEAAALVQRLIACGQEDAENAPDDFDDPEREDALALEVVSIGTGP